MRRLSCIQINLLLWHLTLYYWTKHIPLYCY